MEVNNLNPLVHLCSLTPISLYLFKQFQQEQQEEQ